MSLSLNVNYRKIMKEIDFLPEWYKNGRRRQIGYRTQYIALGGILVVMLAWNLSASHSISKARAEYSQMASKQAQAEKVSAELAGLQDELRRFQNKAESIKEIDSKIEVAGVIAEISYLIDERVVLSKVELISEKFAEKRKVTSSPNAGAVVRAIPGKLSRKELPLGDVRFKIVLGGVAADASDVAALICKLEDSPYFSQVVPSFSRNTEIKSLRGSSFNPRADFLEESEDVNRSSRQEMENIRVSEFEIVCYLANYREL
jgi:hypothetical protein